jgi:hypothetical protein
MNDQQYEGLCRYFLAQKLEMNIERISSVRIPNPARPGMPQYQHQIDLYWETESNLGLYLHIANAKWRGSVKVDQPEVLLLQQVKQKVGAHKAMMLTNLGFTAGAIAVAKDEGIALHIVKPNFEEGMLSAQDRSEIQANLNGIASASSQPIFLYEIVHKAFDFREVAIQSQFSTSASGYATKVISGYETKVGGGYTHKAGTTGGSSGDVRTQGGGPETKSGGPIKTK